MVGPRQRRVQRDACAFLGQRQVPLVSASYLTAHDLSVNAMHGSGEGAYRHGAAPPGRRQYDPICNSSSMGSNAA
jgi:hypothetical protein